MQQLERRVKSLELFRDKVEERGFVYLGKGNEDTVKQATKLSNILRRSEQIVQRTFSNPTDMIAMQRPPDPPQGSIPPAVVAVATNLVWPVLRDWIVTKDAEGSRKSRFGNFLRLVDPKNVRQALFDRDRKAQEKYGSGLAFETEVPSFEKSVEKLSDSVYFLFKTLKSAQDLATSNTNEYQRQLNLVTDLHSILGSFIADLKLK